MGARRTALDASAHWVVLNRISHASQPEQYIHALYKMDVDPHKELSDLPIGDIVSLLKNEGYEGRQSMALLAGSEFMQPQVHMWLLPLIQLVPGGYPTSEASINDLNCITVFAAGDSAAEL